VALEVEAAGLLTHATTLATRPLSTPRRAYLCRCGNLQPYIHRWRATLPLWEQDNTTLVEESAIWQLDFEAKHNTELSAT
jgi:hypothetical protein